MDQRLPVRVIAGCFALAAFAVAIVSGLASHAAATDILTRALLALVACYLLGTCIAMAMNVAVRENIEQFEKDHPFKAPTPSSQHTTPPAPTSA